MRKQVRWKKTAVSMALGLSMVMTTMLVPVKNVYATTSKASVATFAELETALNDSKVKEITVTSEITIPDGQIIDGGKTKVIKAAVTGTNCMGIANDNPSENSLFYVATGSTVTITDVTIYGGAFSAIRNYGTLNVTGTTMTRCGSEYATGSAINNRGKAKLIECNIYRNVAQFGAAFLNGENATMVMDRCAVTENRNIGGGSQGGGACENQGDLYLNNCTYSNNQSTEIGGAINNHSGNIWMSNSTVTGNITSQNASYGGGIGMNGGTAKIVNSVLLDNYALSGTNPVASDIGGYHNGTVTMINSRYGAAPDIETTGFTNCVSTADNKTVFTDYRDKVYLGADGLAVGNQKYNRPMIYRTNDTKNGTDTLLAPLKVASGDLALTGGIAVYFNCSDVANVKMGYGTDDSITAMTTNAPVAADKITVFQDNKTDGRTGLVMGASGTSSDTYFDVTAVVSANGDIEGASIYGDSYKTGTDVTVKFIGSNGYAIDKVQYYEDEDWKDFDTTADVFKFNVAKDYTIKATYQKLNDPYNDNGGEITTNKEGDTGIAVWGKILAGTPVTPPEDGIFCVVIQWGSLKYEYSQGTWDPAQYQYTGMGWSPVNSGVSDKLTVINKSTVGITADFAYANAGGRFGSLNGDFCKEVAYTTDYHTFDLTAMNEETGAIDSDSNYLKVDGTPSDLTATDDYVNIGTVTVTISQN